MTPPGIHISTLYKTGTLPTLQPGSIVVSHKQMEGPAATSDHMLSSGKEGEEEVDGGVVCDLCGRSLPSAAWLPIHAKLIHADSGQHTSIKIYCIMLPEILAYLLRSSIVLIFRPGQKLCGFGFFPVLFKLCGYGWLLSCLV
jgi:hypothetical protein